MQDRTRKKEARDHNIDLKTRKSCLLCSKSPQLFGLFKNWQTGDFDVGDHQHQGIVIEQRRS